MILDLLILISLILSLLVGWFELFALPLWVVILPVSLAYALRFLALAYMRFSHPRWERFQQMQAAEKEGMVEFRDVMIGVILGMLKKTPIVTEEESEETPPAPPEGSEYSPPGYEEED
jgi:hypothetical protein